MAHGHQPSGEKIVYVGDSRVKANNRMPNIPRDYSAYPGKSEAFIPNFLLKEWMVAVVCLVGILVLVMSEPAPLGYPADPTNTQFIPMPDWYFLFLYQLLKYPYTSGDYLLVGVLGVPGIAFGALLLAPFLDTGKERRFYRRPIASGMMLLSLAAVTYLTVFSWHHYTKELEEKNIIPEHIKREEERKAGKEGGGGNQAQTPAKAATAIVEPDDPSYKVFQKASCAACHGKELQKGSAPKLIGIGSKYDAAQILDIIKKGKGGMPAQYDALKGGGLADADIEKLAAWLAKQKAQ
ncbi:c-type cytochrome [Gorillibacterium sp. sgz5001074]|uniref:c-type cytochrome n=1 Tax=Gorillibacterium sp. sgz5001074 TaxID=3446695 RepID=UPI003F679A02